jgi:peptide/nickel transport system substrate-binding protein
MRRRTPLLLTLAALPLTLAACSGGHSKATTASSAPASVKKGGTATFALPPGTYANWIFPMIDSGHSSVDVRNQFQYLMYRPLYWFGLNGRPVLNPQLSLAEPPVYSGNGRTVTIKMKGYRWSNGERVDAQDVVFWLNMLAAEKKNWAYYVPGGLPDNLVSWKSSSPTTVTLTLKSAYNPKFFTYNELSQITPLPLAWDKTSSTTKGSCATKVSACPAVWHYLYDQSKNISSYTTSPIWQVVDGPWRLAGYQTTGYSVFVPNPKYSGPVKPKLSKFIEEPFTTDSSELNVLRSGKVTYGYLPLTDVGEKAVLARSGYRLEPWLDSGVNYFPENFNNPTGGPIFRQLYARQAFQHLVNQTKYIKTIFHGYASPDYGPVPVAPPNPFVDSYEKSDPYPFSVSAARHLLASHGWTVHPGGVDTCHRPGNGPHDCGKGIPSGASMSFTLTYASGDATLSAEMQDLKSTFSQAGIQLNLSEGPFDSVIAQAVPCTPSQASCKWQMVNWGGGWSYSMDHYPIGALIFGTGAGDNVGNYSDPRADHLMAEAESRGGSLDPIENYLAKQLPAVFMPKADYQLSEISSSLHGVGAQEPTFVLTPENWYFTR